MMNMNMIMIITSPSFVYDMIDSNVSGTLYLLGTCVLVFTVLCGTLAPGHDAGNDDDDDNSACACASA